MLRGFLNEIKNTAINRATNKLNNIVSDALGGGRTDAFNGRNIINNQDDNNASQEIETVNI